MPKTLHKQKQKTIVIRRENIYAGIIVMIIMFIIAFTMTMPIPIA